MKFLNPPAKTRRFCPTIPAELPTSCPASRAFQESPRGMKPNEPLRKNRTKIKNKTFLWKSQNHIINMFVFFQHQKSKVLAPSIWKHRIRKTLEPPRQRNLCYSPKGQRNRRKRRISNNPVSISFEHNRVRQKADPLLLELLAQRNKAEHPKLKHSG